MTAFWIKVSQVCRVAFLVVCGLFVISLFGGAASATTGFLMLIFVAAPIAGVLRYAHEKAQVRPS